MKRALDNLSETEGVTRSDVVPPVCRNPDDDWVLASAQAGRCSCLITGDRDLLVLNEFDGIPILAPSAFWRFEADSSGPG